MSILNRNSFVIALVLIGITSTTSRSQQFLIGVRGGGDLARQSLDSTAMHVATSFHGGLAFGGEIDYCFVNSLSLCAQVLYDTKGTHSTFSYITQDTPRNAPSANLSEADDLVLRYVEVPIFLRGYFLEGSIRPYAFAGVSVGRYLSGNQQSHQVVTATSSMRSGGSTGFTVTRDTLYTLLDSEIKSYDISLLFGAGLSYQISPGAILFLDGSYSLGLTSVSNGLRMTNIGDQLGYTNFATGTDMVANHTKSRDFRIMVGVMFSFGGSERKP